jgi:hypothetical protein
MRDQRMLAGRAKIRGSVVDVDKGGRRRVHVESVQARQEGRMVIARDRRSGVSRSILGGFTLPPGATPPEPDAHLAATGTRSSKAPHALRQAGTFAAGCQRQPKLPRVFLVVEDLGCRDRPEDFLLDDRCVDVFDFDQTGPVERAGG